MAGLTPPILKLVSLLNQQAPPPDANPFSRLNAGAPASWLVRDAAIGHAILKSPYVKPYDLLRYFKRVARIEDGALGAIEGYFGHGPLLLHGEKHHEVRKTVVQQYQTIEIDLLGWLDAYTQDFLQSHCGSPVTTTRLAGDYVDGLYRTLLARQLGCEPQALPPLPGLLFDLLPRKTTLQRANAELQALADACQIGKNSSTPAVKSDPWALVTLVVMGKDALQTSLLFALHHRNITDAETLFRLSTPVSVIAREVTHPTTFGGESFSAGDILYLCPSLMEAHPTHGKLEFGAGQHICAGRKIAMIVAKAFLQGLQATEGLIIRTNDLQWTRNLLLTPKEIE